MVKYLKRSCLLCCVSSQSVNQTVDQPMKFDTLLLILRHYNKCSISGTRYCKCIRYDDQCSSTQPYLFLMTSWYGNTFRIADPLWGNPPVTDGFPCDLWLRPRDMSIEIGVIHKGIKWGSLVTVKAWYQSGDKHHLNQRWLIDPIPRRIYASSSLNELKRWITDDTFTADSPVPGPCTQN